MDEQQKFLEGLEGDQTPADIFELPLDGEPAVVTEETEVEDTDGDLKPKNRRERRLMRKLQEERESSMFLAGKLEARNEARSALDEESDYLKTVEHIYGTDTPETRTATDLLKKAMIGLRDDAENRAYDKIKAEQQREQQIELDATNELDSYIDDIEDTYDVELNPVQQTAYFQLLQKMSPKDRDGNVTQYADPHAVWEVFQEKITPKGTDNRAKALANRSMVQSGSPAKENSLQDDTHTRFLKENGII